jgi:hypothetical protein
MNRLRGTIAYLAGAMDEVPDLGVDWRLDIQEFIWSLGAGVLNPCDKASIHATEDQDSRNARRKLKYLASQCTSDLQRNYYYSQVHEIMKEIVAFDLRMVDIAHFIVLNIDKEYHMCGSYNEQTHACMQRKPVIVHCKQGIHHIPDWLFGICKHEMFFDNWGDVRKYLIHVNEDKVVDDYNRWRFFDFKKVFNVS